MAPRFVCIRRTGGMLLPPWLERFVPSVDTILVVAPIALLVGIAAAALASRLRARGVRTPYTRKVFHFTIFTAASVIQLLGGVGGVVVFGSVVALIVLFAVWRGEKHPFYEALARPNDVPRRTLFIIVPLV